VVCRHLQIDSTQFQKIMSYIQAGKDQGATLKHGAPRFLSHF